MPLPLSADTMNVASKFIRSLAALTRPSRLGLSTRSILLATRSLIRFLVAGVSLSLSTMAEVSSSRPRLASTSKATMSASWAPFQATATMARSSRRRGAKMPGVSTKISCDCPSIAMPRMTVRVVCTLGLTIVTLLPTIALTRVDLPTLGAPMTATKPQRCSAASSGPSRHTASLDALFISTGCCRLHAAVDTAALDVVAVDAVFHVIVGNIVLGDAVPDAVFVACLQAFFLAPLHGFLHACLHAFLGDIVDPILNAFAAQHGGGGGLLGGALRAAHALGRHKLREAHSHQEFRVMMRAGA